MPLDPVPDGLPAMACPRCHGSAFQLLDHEHGMVAHCLRCDLGLFIADAGETPTRDQRVAAFEAYGETVH